MAHLKPLARALITGIVLWIVLHLVDARLVLDAVRAARPGGLALAVALALGTRVLFILRWRALLAAQAIRIPLPHLTRIVFVSMFLGQGLPGVAGGDVLRGAAVARTYGKPGRVAVSLAANSGLAALSLLALTLIGVMFAPRGSAVREHGGVIVIVAAGVGVIVLFLLMLRGRVKEILSRLVLPRRVLLFILATSLLGQALRCLLFLTLYRALGATVGLAETFVLIPAMSVILLVPTSMGGLGVREGALAVLFGQVGVAAEVSVAVGFLYFAAQAAASVPGAWWWMRKRRSDSTSSGPGREDDPIQSPASSRSTRSHSSSSASASASRAARSDSSDRSSSGETES